MAYFQMLFQIVFAFVFPFVVLAPMANIPGKRQGVRQRLGLDKHTAPPVPDPLSAKICQSFAMGKLAASDAGAFARAAQQSGTSSSSVDRIASAAPTAASGSSNSHRSFKRSLLHMSQSATKDLEPYYCQVPVWDDVHEVSKLETSAFLPIHEALDLLIPKGQEAEYCSLDEPSQAGLRGDLREWQHRVHADITLPLLALCLWGGHSPNEPWRFAMPFIC